MSNARMRPDGRVSRPVCPQQIPPDRGARRRRGFPILAAALAGLTVGCSAGGASEPAPEPPKLSVGVQTIPLPADVKGVRGPAFVGTDDDDAVFSFASADGSKLELGYIRLDGTGFECLTCGTDTGGEKPQPFPDGSRVFLTQSAVQSPTQSSYSVLQCLPSLADCQTQRVKPVQGFGDPTSLQDRVPKLSPDGQWILFTRIRVDGYFLLLARLVEEADHYQVTNPRMINPPADPGLGAVDRLSAVGAWYEGKDIGFDGRTIAFASTRGDSLNIDWFTMDLVTGRATRLTTDPDWDENSQLSPDLELMKGGMTAGHNLLAAFGNLPRPPILDFAVIGPLTNYYLPRGLPVDIPGRDRKDELEPTVLSIPTGEAIRYTETDKVEGWSGDGAGSRGWGDGRQVLNAQTNAETGESRLRLFTFSEHPPFTGTIQPVVEPTWAPFIKDVPLMPRAVIKTVQGTAGGYATVSLVGSIAAGTFSVVYVGYSTDGCSYLDGSQVSVVTAAIVAEYSEDLRVSGCHQGKSSINVLFADFATQGQATSEYDGRAYKVSYGVN